MHAYTYVVDYIAVVLYPGSIEGVHFTSHG